MVKAKCSLKIRPYLQSVAALCLQLKWLPLLRLHLFWWLIWKKQVLTNIIPKFRCSWSRTGDLATMVQRRGCKGFASRSGGGRQWVMSRWLTFTREFRGRQVSISFLFTVVIPNYTVKLNEVVWPPWFVGCLLIFRVIKNNFLYCQWKIHSDTSQAWCYFACHVISDDLCHCKQFIVIDIFYYFNVWNLALNH